MSLLSRVSQFLLGASSPVNRRDYTPEAWFEAFSQGQSLTGIHVSQQSALAASAVVAAVTMLAEDVAKLPWSVFTNVEGEAKKEAKGHFLYNLLQEPNDWQNGLEFREQLQVSLILRGNGYAVIRRSARGTPIALIPVNADWMGVYEAPDGDLFYRVTALGLHLAAALRGLPSMIPAADVLHIRGFSLNGLAGLSRISLAREAIALFLAQEQQAARWMGNGAKPSGVLTTDQRLTPDAATRIAADWKDMHGGLQNSGKTAVLEQGLKWQQLSMSSSDMEFLESRKFQLQEIARIFRIPLHMMGELTRSTNNNIAQQAQEYINYTLTGYTNRWSAKLSSTFGLRKDGLSVDFDYRALTTADLGTRINNWRTMIMSMIGKPDEARVDLGLDRIGGDADKLQKPTNMAAAGSQSTGTAPDEAGRPSGDQPTN